MSEKFDIDHNRLFGMLEEVLSQDRTQLALDANGGNSILFVYPNDEDNLYVAEAKRRFHDNAIFVDVAQALTDFQEEMGMETFKELEEEIGTDVYYRKELPIPSLNLLSTVSLWLLRKDCRFFLSAPLQLLTRASPI